MNNVIALPRRTYSAKLFVMGASGFNIHIAGELEGLIDIAIEGQITGNRTYQITPDEARMLASKLLSCAEDVAANCLYDRDALLVDREP